MSRVGRAGNGTKTFLHVPTENNLIDSLAVCLSNLLKCCIVYIIPVVIQRIPTFNLNIIVVSVQLSCICSLSKRMTFYLCHLWLNLRVLHNIVERLHSVIEVTDTQSSYSTSFILLFHYPPTCKYIIQSTCRMMNIHEIKVIYLQTLKHSVKSILCIS